MGVAANIHNGITHVWWQIIRIEGPRTRKGVKTRCQAQGCKMTG